MKAAEERAKAPLRLAEPPEDGSEAEKSRNWRERVPKRLPGVEVVMTKRPKKIVSFREPVEDSPSEQVHKTVPVVYNHVRGNIPVESQQDSGLGGKDVSYLTRPTNNIPATSLERVREEEVEPSGRAVTEGPTGTLVRDIETEESVRDQTRPEELVETPSRPRIMREAAPELVHKAVPVVKTHHRGKIPVENQENLRMVDKDVSYLRRSTHNIPVTDRERAYSIRSLVDEIKYSSTIGQDVLNTPITVELGKLIQASPSLAVELRNATTKRRKVLKHKAMNSLMQESEFPYMEDSGVEVSLEYDAINIADLPTVTSLYISTEEDRDWDPHIKAGYMVVPDPYLQYLASLGPDKVPRQVFVASESASLRCVFPTIDGKYQIEAVIDSGSQIVSMALKIAEELNLIWDPDVQIFMQSANSSMKKSAGLARNVPFVFGGITVYLQVHVIENPAYKVLLGRPFDILTESQVKNSSDGGQTVTLTDPNTLTRVTIPTHPRGTFTTAKKVLPAAVPVPNQGRPTKQADFRRATVEEVQDESEISDDEGTDSSDEESDADFRRSSRN